MLYEQKDLAVTPAKLRAVKNWITESLQTNTQNGNKVDTTRRQKYHGVEINAKNNIVGKLLIISGPSGCGKSTTIRTLARVMAFDIHEWMPFGPTTKWNDLEDKQGKLLDERN
jgi:ABC-type lipoprotein export system ATPase subunit